MTYSTKEEAAAVAEKLNQRKGYCKVSVRKTKRGWTVSTDIRKIS